MSQSLANLVVHLTFSTKERRPLIRDDIRSQLHAYILSVLNNHDSPSIETNSVEDHIHILFALSKNWPLAKVIEQVKSTCSDWIKQQSDWYRDFYGQHGCRAFSVSQTHVDTVRQYIRNQQAHHEKVTFQDKFRELCRKNNAPFNERYA